MRLGNAVWIAVFAAASTVTVWGQAAQTPIVGADVSFLLSMEGKGIVFKDAGVSKPGLQILKDHGYNWVRLRLFKDPVTLPNNLRYTIVAAKDAQALGFKVLLDLHYADDWADPAHEPTPVAWKSLAHADLQKAVFAYTRDVIKSFKANGVMPDMVQVGNEVTSGMMWPDGKLPDRWDQFAELVSAGILGIDAGRGASARPQIMIHIDQGGNSETTQWFFDNLTRRGVAFDVIGQSYYPWWQGSLDGLRGNLRFMADRYKKPIIVVETAYDWKTGEAFHGKPPYPETPEGQRDFLIAVRKAVAETPYELGLGFFYWEPMAEGAIARRGMFNDDHEALPAVHAFDKAKP